MARAFASASSQSMQSTSIVGVPMTFACWVQLASNPFGVAMGLGRTGTSQHYHYIGADNTATYAGSNDGGGEAFASAGAPTLNTWTHLAGVFASTASRIVYKDGTPGSAETSGRNPTLTTTVIGANLSNVLGTWWDGKIAEAAMWGAALTQQDLSMLAAGFSPLLVQPNALVRYWPLLGVFSPEIDLSSRLDLTLTNAPTAAAHPRILTPAMARVQLGAAAAATTPRLDGATWRGSWRGMAWVGR